MGPGLVGVAAKVSRVTETRRRSSVGLGRPSKEPDRVSGEMEGSGDVIGVDPRGRGTAGAGAGSGCDVRGWVA